MAHRCPDCFRVCNCDREVRLPIVHRFLPASDCAHCFWKVSHVPLPAELASYLAKVGI